MLIQKIEYLDNAISCDGNNFIFNFYKGLVYVGVKDYHRAFDSFLKSLELSGNNYIVLNEIGHTYIKLGEYAQAERYFLRAIALAGVPTNAFIGLGVVQNRLKKHSDAINSYSAALELEPNNALAYNNRANAYRMVGELKKAMDDVYKGMAPK